MWRKIRLAIALIVAAFSLVYATFDYMGWLDKMTGREMAFSGLYRLSSTKGYPEVIIFNDEKEFKPLLKFILSNTKDPQTINLTKQGQFPTAMVRLGGPIPVPLAGPPNVDYDPRFVLESSPVMVFYNYLRGGPDKNVDKTKHIARPIGNLRDIRTWIENSKNRDRFLFSSILIGVLSILVVVMEWRSKH